MESSHLTVIMQKMFSFVGEHYTDKYCMVQGWYLLHEWTEQQELEFKQWLYLYLLENKQARIQIMEHPTKNSKQLHKLCDQFVWQYGWKLKV
jgi:hypothetical protein